MKTSANDAVAAPDAAAVHAFLRAISIENVGLASIRTMAIG
jgi:hypothetical protein